LLVAVLGLAACESPQTVAPVAVAPVSDPHSVVGSADWAHSETIGLTVASFSFTPDSLAFQRGKPYKLHLVNQSSDDHTFNSKTFFQAIAVQKLMKQGVETPMSAPDGFDLAAGEQADLTFVAVTPGAYKFYCNKFMHDMLGMTGTITIQ
jgi:uncharacterized cupredoxin-like copper-binding protein